MYELDAEICKLNKRFEKIGDKSNEDGSKEKCDKVELTEAILKAYRKIKFNVENNVCAVPLELEKYINIKIPTPGNDNINFHCIDIMDNALLKLKKYPKYGKIYYEIIFDRFIGKKIYTYDEIADRKKMSKKNVLMKKDEAVCILSEMLWGASPEPVSIVLVEHNIGN